MLPLSQPEINQYRKAFRQFANRLDDDNVLITMQDMVKLLGELGKTHSETDAKTLFNELEIAADGTGWILDLPTFMVLMLHKGNRRTSRVKRHQIGKSTQQWQVLLTEGTLPTTETIIDTDHHSLEQIKIARYKFKSFSASRISSIRYPNLQNEYGVEFPQSECQLCLPVELHGKERRLSQTSLSSGSTVLFQDGEQIVPKKMFGLAEASTIIRDETEMNSKRCCIL